MDKIIKPVTKVIVQPLTMKEFCPILFITDCIISKYLTVSPILGTARKFTDQIVTGFYALAFGIISKPFIAIV